MTAHEPRRIAAVLEASDDLVPAAVHADEVDDLMTYWLDAA